MRIAFVALIIASHSPFVALAADDAGRRDFFERKIRPVLVAKCYGCHSAEAAQTGKLKGMLRVDSRASLAAGGESGAVILAGKPNDSPLLDALKYKGLEMPPDGKLSDAIIADFEQWIADGAVDPREGVPLPTRKEINFQEARQFWSFQPIVKSQPPRLNDEAWAKNPVDQFVLANLKKVKLEPSPDASDRMLVRRLYFDLTGLPPSPTEVRDFLERARSDRDAAIDDLVDKLLASPHFGERWGRHWLDVVRFAESNGRDQNIVWHHAWRYRQYVIDAFNADKPFDQFIREQIAGDLVPYKSRTDRDAGITATGMLAMSPKNIEETNKALFRMDLLDDQIEVTTRAFLGLSVSCARCHDHKFDPIPTKDYYALAGIFGSSEPLYGPARWGTKGTPHKHYLAIGERADSLEPAATAHVKALEQAHLDFIQARVDRYRVVRKVADLKNQAMKPGADKAVLEPEIAKLDAEILDWDAKIKELGKTLEDKIANPPPQPEWVMALRDGESPEDVRIHVRGETNNLREVVPRGVLQLIDIPGLPAIEANQSGRLQLAQWLASSQNPLTPRVAVNRVWLHVFGQGLVKTVDDFGTTGARPTHPELLDYLAARFVEEGWSVKKLVRLLVTSRTYRQASDFVEQKHNSDADNDRLWRMNPKRLEVEPFRDAVLTVSGKLSLQPPEEPFLAKFNPYKHHTWASHDAFVKPAEMEFPHRTVYLPVIRGVLPELLSLFDFADPNRVVGQRGESVVPSQALFLLNSPWMLEHSRYAAQQILAIRDLDDRQRLEALYERALSRPPTTRETELLLRYLDEPTDLDAKKAEPENRQLNGWTRVCQIIFSSAEFHTLR